MHRCELKHESKGARKMNMGVSTGVKVGVTADAGTVLGFSLHSRATASESAVVYMDTSDNINRNDVKSCNAGMAVSVSTDVGIVLNAVVRVVDDFCAS